MGDRNSRSMSDRMSAMASAVTRWAGGNWGFAFALGTVLIWLACGPIFKWSDTWQLVINTGTTIVTFLMVFLIQRTQNKDGLAIQLKLNELVAAIEGANNRLIDVEDLSEDELRILRKHYEKLADMAQNEEPVDATHSLAEAEQRHHHKRTKRRSSQAVSKPTER
jgi:low affinity Fe/Cu permease